LQSPAYLAYVKHEKIAALRDELVRDRGNPEICALTYVSLDAKFGVLESEMTSTHKGGVFWNCICQISQSKPESDSKVENTRY